MPKMIIEVPEGFEEVGKAMAEQLGSLERTVARLGGGKSVDYAAIEEAMQEAAGRSERAGHRAILQKRALVNKFVFEGRIERVLHFI